MKSKTFFQKGEPSVNPETLENAMNGGNYDPQMALSAFFLVPGVLPVINMGILEDRGQSICRKMHSRNFYRLKYTRQSYLCL